MTQQDYNRLTSQLEVLKQVAKEYQGKTIDNIIQQMEERAKEYRCFNYKLLLTEYIEMRSRYDNTEEENAVLSNLNSRLLNFNSNELILAKLHIMLDSHKKSETYLTKMYGKPHEASDYAYAEDRIARDCLNYLHRSSRAICGLRKS